MAPLGAHQFLTPLKISPTNCLLRRELSRRAAVVFEESKLVVPNLFVTQPTLRRLKGGTRYPEPAVPKLRIRAHFRFRIYFHAGTFVPGWCVTNQSGNRSWWLHPENAASMNHSMFTGVLTHSFRQPVTGAWLVVGRALHQHVIVRAGFPWSSHIKLHRPHGFATLYVLCKIKHHPFVPAEFQTENFLRWPRLAFARLYS
jgi:hypothetical protein